MLYVRWNVVGLVEWQSELFLFAAAMLSAPRYPKMRFAVVLRGEMHLLGSWSRRLVDAEVNIYNNERSCPGRFVGRIFLE